MIIHNYFSDPNEAVLTTSFVLDKADQITRVYHYFEDGMWEFVGETKAEESDYSVVSMEEIIKLDNTLLSLSNMDPGYFAYRTTGNNVFVIEKISNDT
ncbi:hypothetical protein [Sphingobacterium sp. LRF_L2]|uniref:hypothetical protein n=1 Tax=Sphingobacterium sp. LRF_L2 TaxID=3369421 RepID=UPI003F60FB52